MSGISRFFAPAKCADAKTETTVPDNPATTTNDGPPKHENEDGSKDESVTAVDGIELDKDGWQIFPQNVASAAGGDSEILCIDIGDSEEEDDDGNVPMDGQKKNAENDERADVTDSLADEFAAAAQRRVELRAALDDAIAREDYKAAAELKQQLGSEE